MIIPIEEKDISDAAKILLDFWKSTGMKNIDENTAIRYIEEGHGFDCISDEFFIYKNDSEVCGIISLIIYNNETAEIKDLAVRKDERRKGIGTELAQYVIGIAKKRDIKKIAALMQEENIGFYEKQEFSLEQKINKTESHLEHDIYVMVREL